jgi:hypothetical protein
MLIMDHQIQKQEKLDLNEDFQQKSIEGEHAT